MTQLRYKVRERTTKVILHDSHTSPDFLTAANVPRWADLAKVGGLKMGLLSVGYHFIIERDGTRIECRPRDQIGSHTPGSNLDTIGVCLVGGRADISGSIPEDNFLKAQRLEVFRLMVDLRLHYATPTLPLFGKSEVQRYRRKDKPNSPYLDMDLLREDLELYTKGIIL